MQVDELRKKAVRRHRVPNKRMENGESKGKIVCLLRIPKRGKIVRLLRIRKRKRTYVYLESLEGRVLRLYQDSPDRVPDNRVEGDESKGKNLI